MDLIGQTLELSIPGRWGRADRTDVVVLDAFSANQGRSYLQVESLKTGGLYLLTARYDGDRLDGLEPGRLIAVVIGKLKEGASPGEFALSHETEKYFSYYGGGAVQLLDSELEAMRRGKSGGEGFFGPLVEVIESIMGRKKD